MHSVLKIVFYFEFFSVNTELDKMKVTVNKTNAINSSHQVNRYKWIRLQIFVVQKYSIHMLVKLSDVTDQELFYWQY